MLILLPALTCGDLKNCLLVRWKVRKLRGERLIRGNRKLMPISHLRGLWNHNTLRVKPLKRLTPVRQWLLKQRRRKVFTLLASPHHYDNGVPILPVPGLVRSRAYLAMDVDTRVLLYTHTVGSLGRLLKVYDASVRIFAGAFGN